MLAQLTTQSETVFVAVQLEPELELMLELGVVIEAEFCCVDGEVGCVDGDPLGCVDGDPLGSPEGDWFGGGPSLTGGDPQSPTEIPRT